MDLWPVCPRWDAGLLALYYTLRSGIHRSPLASPISATVIVEQTQHWIVFTFSGRLSVITRMS
jgi:hypothetical protein